jgi:nucleoside-diphosphate-sugar epimerase
VRRALVTGATGCVGRAVVAALLRDGWAVRGLARNAAPGSPAARRVGDAAHEAAVRAAAAGCEAVVHLASWVHRVARTDADRAAVCRSIVDGTRHVVEAAGGARLVFASTVAVYGSFPPQPADETTPPAPDTPYGEAKLEAEDLVRAQAAAAAILRIALVYGTYDRGNFAALARALARRRAFIVGRGDNRKSLVYADNLADRIVRLCANDVGGTFIAADVAPTQRELMTQLAGALGRRPPLAVPRGALLLAGRLLDLVSGPRWADRVRKLEAATEFSGARLDSALGYAPRVSFPDGLRRAAAWYKEA